MTAPQKSPATGRTPDPGRSYDVAIVGGGVSGVALFRALARRGHRVLLVDRGDFGSGTSQASGMLAWGGLLYLRNLELRTVAKLSAARDRWIAGKPGEVRVAPFRYLPQRRGGRAAWWVRVALETYWLLGAARRKRPFRDRMLPEERWPFVAPGRFGRALGYEEAAMTDSDARLVLTWLLDSVEEQRVALDHTALVGAQRSEGGWRLELESADGRNEVEASVLVNAAGVWADRVSELVGVRTEHRHALSKGVYLVLRRPRELDACLAFEMGERGDVLTLTPWDDVALWGSTETIVDDPDGGFAPTPEDVAALARPAAQHLARPLAFEDVVALRTGVRPLALRRGAPVPEDPLDLSRKHVVEVNAEARVVTLFGGKFTSAAALGREAADRIASLARGTGTPGDGRRTPRPPAQSSFPGHAAPVIDPADAREFERCRTLEDYLRRRTSIAQGIPRLGLGRGNENEEAVRRIAEVLEGEEHAAAAVKRLRAAADFQDDVVRRGLMDT